MHSIEWRYFQRLWVTTNYPQMTPISTVCITFHIFVAGEDRVFKLGGYVDCIVSASPRMTNHPGNGRG